MGSEPQGWTGELPSILRFLPCQSCCFLHFLELLSKLRWGGQEQIVNKPLAPPPRPHHITPILCQPCHLGRDFRNCLQPLVSGTASGKKAWKMMPQ